MSERVMNSESDSEGLLFRLLKRVIDIRPREPNPLALSCLYFFSVLSAYYVIRPIRDEIGAARSGELQWLFTGTLAGMILANPPFAAFVSRLAPLRFIKYTYRFFAANLILFFAFLQMSGAGENPWLGRIFFVWAAVFNLFVVSVFWGFRADVFNNEQSRRLFGFIAVGGTLGGIAGSSITAALVNIIGRSYLLLISALLLKVAVFSVQRLSFISQAMRERHDAGGLEAAVGGSVLSGLSNVLKSSYLLNISLYTLLLAILYTFVYFQQSSIVRNSIAEPAARTSFLANIDLTVNVLTLAIQLFLTGKIIKKLGIAASLTLLPALTVATFLLLGFAPVLWSIVVAQVLRRAADFALSRPASQILYTVVPREDKYKAKSFIETFIYRVGDQVGAWSYAWMVPALAVAGVSFVAVPVSLGWLANALWLGRRQERLALRQGGEPQAN